MIWFYAFIAFWIMILGFCVSAFLFPITVPYVLWWSLNQKKSVSTYQFFVKFVILPWEFVIDPFLNKYKVD